MTKKPINIEFQIKEIDLLSIQLPGYDKKFIDPNEVEFDITLEQRINPENETVIVNCTICAYNLGKEVLLGSIKVGCMFHVKSMDSLLTKDKGAINLPSKFIETINIVTIGTVRGMMFSEFKGTYLANAILPLIDPAILSTNQQPVLKQK
jgi:hypothetical protein